MGASGRVRVLGGGAVTAGTKDPLPKPIVSLCPLEVRSTDPRPSRAGRLCCLQGMPSQLFSITTYFSTPGPLETDHLGEPSSERPAREVQRGSGTSSVHRSLEAARLSPPSKPEILSHEELEKAASKSCETYRENRVWLNFHKLISPPNNGQVPTPA